MSYRNSEKDFPELFNNPNLVLELEDEGIDNLGRKQTYASACTVFLRDKNENILCLIQTKPDSITEGKIVGLGGKSILNTYLGSVEKINTESWITSLYYSTTSQEDIRDVAVREVFEETGGYDKDDTLSGYGIKIEKDKLKGIGNSSIRICTEGTNTLMDISYFIYDLDSTEGTIMPGSLKEGMPIWIPYKELLQANMFPADSIIIKNLTPSIYIEGIYDFIGDVHKLRVIKITENEIIKILFPNYKKSYYIGEVYPNEKSNYLIGNDLFESAELEMIIARGNTSSHGKSIQYPLFEELVPVFKDEAVNRK